MVDSTTTTDETEELGYYDGQVHRWLMKYRRLMAYRDQLRKIAKAQLAEHDGLKAVRYDIEKVLSSLSKDGVHNSAMRHMEIGEMYDKLADEASASAERISAAILAVSDLDSRQALLGHYIEGQTWEALCVQPGFECSYRTMMRRRKRGLMEIYDRDLMPLTERDPRYSAL